MSKWFGSYPECTKVYKPRIGHIYIYALADAITEEVRYIGQATNLKRRYWQHCRSWGGFVGPGAPLRNNWFHAHWQKRRGPEMRVLAVVPDARADEVERAYIQHALANDMDLLNVVRNWSAGVDDWGKTQYGELPY